MLTALTEERDAFAANRKKLLESADSVIGPAVRQALKRFPNGQWWAPILDAGERVFRRSFRRETGTNKHPDLQREVDLFRSEIQPVLMRATDDGPATAQRLTKWVSTAATNAGTTFAARTQGAQIGHEWVTMHDTRVREAHQEADGQRQPVGQNFFVGGFPMRYPGDPRAPIELWINCRCVLRPVAIRASGEIMTDTVTADVGEPEAPADLLTTDGPVPWHGVLAPESVMSGDRRQFAKESLRWRDLPLPLTWQKTSDDGHKGGVTVARIDKIWRDGNLIKGEGIWDTSEDASEALRQNAEGFLRGVSVDVDDHEYEQTFDDEGLPEATTFTSGRICGATLVGIPAFQEAFVSLGTWDEADSPVEPLITDAPQGPPPQDGEGGDMELVAAAVSNKPWSNFTDADYSVEQYHRAAILHRHDGAPTSKADCSLPIREPNGTLNRNGVHAAASRINQVSNASPEQKAKAKASLRGAYNQMGETPPDNIKAALEFTDEEAPFARGPGWVTAPVATRRIHDYWVHGEGAGKIAWGVPGDFNRCRKHLAKYVAPEHLSGTCAQWHHDALGVWPGRPVAGDTETFTDCEDCDMAPAVNLVASAATVTHRAEFFEDPHLLMPSPLVVSREGRVFGHLATWNECHTGIANKCVIAPHSATDYAYFKTGSVLTDAGEIPTGKITLGGGHADPKLGYIAAAEHYDSTSAVVADVVIGEDQFGPWVSGQVRASATDEQIAALRAAPLSGDWRMVGGNLELVAALAVNVPGFPIPRLSLAASGERITALTACAVVEPGTMLAAGVSGGDLASAVVDEIERRDRSRRMNSFRAERNKARMAALR